MIVRPILFSSPMVRAILEGRKTQTRRVLKPQPGVLVQDLIGISDGKACFSNRNVIGVNVERYDDTGYRPGQIRYVREAWGVGTRPCPSQGWRDGIECKADAIGTDDAIPLYEVNVPDGIELDDLKTGAWRSPIHMPRWASRLTLEVTEVRVQRLQEISEEDALAEGIDMESDFACLCKLIADAPYPNSLPNGSPALAVFEKLWNSINTKRGFGWDVNPWVVAVTFEPHQMNVDDFLKGRSA